MRILYLTVFLSLFISQASASKRLSSEDEREYESNEKKVNLGDSSPKITLVKSLLLTDEVLDSDDLSLVTDEQVMTDLVKLEEFFDFAGQILKERHPGIRPEQVGYAIDWDNTLGRIVFENKQMIRDELLEEAKEAPEIIRQKMELGHKVTVVTARGHIFENPELPMYVEEDAPVSHESKQTEMLTNFHSFMTETGVNASQSFPHITEPLKLHAEQKGHFIPTYMPGVLFAGTQKTSVYKAFCNHVEFTPKVVFVFDDHMPLWDLSVAGENEDGSTYYFIKKIVL